MNRNIDAAARDVQAAINAARSQLPSYLPQNPSYRKANPAEAPILILTLTSDVIPKPQIYDMADSILAQKISQIQGVGQTFVGGSAQPAVRVELNPMQLANNGVGLEAVRTALSAANANRPKGAFDDAQHRWQIDNNDQIFKAADYAPIIVGYNQQTGAAVRVGDLGTVTDSVSDIHTAGLAGNNSSGHSGKLKDAILIVIFKIPGANVIDTVDAVLKEMPRLQAEIPPTIKMDVAVDRTTTIRSSVHDVEITLIISVLLVVLVVFLFLREIWATIIPSVAVPLSLVGTFGVMYLLGYTIDNLSLMALTISTGFVVDDAIVVIENITRYLEEGMNPYDAAMKGSKEIGFTVLSMSTSLIAVFIPILLMGGIIGKLFREFAVTLSVAIAVSLLVSLTTTPMLCARFLKQRDESSYGRLYRVSENAFQWIHHEYNSALRWVLRHQWITLTVAIGCAFLNVYLFMIVPKGFFPQQDTGRLGGRTLAAQDISFPAMAEKQKRLAQMVLEDPAVQTVTAFVGGNGPGGGGTNVGNMFIALKPVNERPYRPYGDDWFDRLRQKLHIHPDHVTADDVVNGLRRKLTSVPGAALFLQAQQDIQVGGRGSDAQYQYTLSDENLSELNTWAPRLLARMRTMPELRDASTDQQDQGLSETLVIDRDTASRLGISAATIDSVLYDAFGQRQVSTMYTGLNQYFVVMEVDPKYQLSPDSLDHIYIKASTTTGAAASVTTLGTTAAATATTTAGPAASTPVPPSAVSGAAAVFPTSGGQLVTSSTTSGTATTSATTASSSTASTASSASTAATTNPVVSNIAAIAASTGESTTAAAIASGTLTGIASSGSSASTTSTAGAGTAATAATTPASTGAMVPLSAIAHWQQKRTSLAVNHQGQYPAVTLTFNLAPNVALGDAVTALQKAQADMGMPTNIHATFQGTAQAFQDSLKNEPYLILAALVAVYIVLGILYESLIHPLTILSTLPPAGVGAILALLITGTDLSIMALIGILLLIGIVKKNAIMMIDFALQAERDHGLPPVEAIYQACLLRFRPIMMTTLAAMFGGLPLAIGMGVGSELRKPLGITIVGGLLVSQMLTLFTTPVVYLFFDKLQWRFMKLHRVGSELEEAPGD